METTQNSSPAQTINESQTNGEATASENSGDEGGGEAAELQNLEAKSEAGANLTKAEKKYLKQLKIKYNGKEITEELPFEIPDDEKSVEYMRKQLQMSKLAQNKSQEFSQLEKEVRTFVEELRKNPKKVLSDPNVGVDVKQLAAQILQEEIEASQKSPEQLERERLENRLKELEDERKKEQEEFKSKELERLKEIEYQRYDQMMTQALEKSDLPKSPYVVKKMADYMLLGLKAGEDVTPEDVLPLVREEIMNDIKEMFAVMPEEVVERIVGTEYINKLRKKRVAQAKAAPPKPLNAAIKDTGQSKKTEEKPKDKVSYKDFFKL